MNHIKLVIKEKGFSITSLADRMGIARESLSRMLVSPSYPTLQKIATALDVPVWRLFVSPEEIAEQQMVSFMLLGGKPHVSSSIDEVIVSLKGWREEDLHNVCREVTFTHIRNTHAESSPVVQILNALCEHLDAECKHKTAD